MILSRYSACAVSVAALCAGLAACTVGPDFHGAPQAAPLAAQSHGFGRAPATGVTAGPALAAWWDALGDPQLTALIQTALRNSPDLQAAQARLRESRANLREQQADGLPKVSASAAALRMREPDLGSLLGASGNSSSASGADGSNTAQSNSSNSSTTGRGPLTLYTAGFDATWEIDLFGGTRRAVEAAGAEADAVVADLADTQVSLAAEVAQAYVGLRDQQQRLLLAHQSAELQQQMLTLTQQRRARGVASEVDIERLTTQVENTRATLIPLDEQITESLDQLAVLTGQEPGTLDASLGSADALPVLPASVAVGDPAALLQRRPDIRAAERRLASSNAQIGAKTADYFPKLSLIGDVGFSAGDPGHLVRKSNFTWIGVPYLQWDVLDFGRTQAAVRQAQAGRDEAEAKYRSTVLNALRDADGALSRYGHQRQTTVSLQQVQASADRSAMLVRQRYRAGTASLIDLLDAQRTQFAAQQDAVSGQAELLKDFVSLQKSLGLGWQAAG